MREARTRHGVEALIMMCWEPPFAIECLEKMRLDERTSAWRPSPDGDRTYVYCLRREGARVEDVTAEIEVRPTPMDRDDAEYLWMLSTQSGLTFAQLFEVAVECAGREWAGPPPDPV